jgi:hypothetical protein
MVVVEEIVTVVEVVTEMIVVATLPRVRNGQLMPVIVTPRHPLHVMASYRLTASNASWNAFSPDKPEVTMV